MNEELVIEVAEWLERAADKCKIGRVWDALSAQKKITCAGFHVDFGVPADGSISVEFFHPIARIKEATNLTDSELAAIEQWINTTPDPKIHIERRTDESYGDCFVLRKTAQGLDPRKNALFYACLLFSTSDPNNPESQDRVKATFQSLFVPSASAPTASGQREAMAALLSQMTLEQRRSAVAEVCLNAIQEMMS